MNKLKVLLVLSWIGLVGIVVISLYIETLLIFAKQFDPYILISFQFPIVISAFILGKVQEKYDKVIELLDKNPELKQELEDEE